MIAQMTTEDTNALIRQAREGSQDACWSLLCQFEPLLDATARRYHGVSYEDALQEARLAFVECVMTYRVDGDIPFAAYAKAKVWGDVRTVMRRWWLHDARMVYPKGASEPQDWGNAASAFCEEEGYEEVDLETVLVQASLSPRELVAVRAFLMGESTSDVAGREGVSPETVKTWKKRAWRKLQRALEER